MRTGALLGFRAWPSFVAREEKGGSVAGPFGGTTNAGMSEDNYTCAE